MATVCDVRFLFWFLPEVSFSVDRGDVKLQKVRVWIKIATKCHHVSIASVYYFYMYMMIYIIHYLIHSENEKKKQKRDDVTLMRKNNHASKAKQNTTLTLFIKLHFCKISWVLSIYFHAFISLKNKEHRAFATKSCGERSISSLKLIHHMFMGVYKVGVFEHYII